MVIKMTREEYEKKYGVPAPGSTPTQKGSTVERVARGITRFIGAEPIAEQYGSTIARSRVPEEQKQFIKDPSLRSVVGSALQTGSLLVPGGASTLAGKAALGAGVGYGIDVGSKLQKDSIPLSEAFKPGVATVVGGALPIVGSLFGKLTGDLAKKLATKLEGTNLRLKKYEWQVLQKKKGGFGEWLASKKLVGNPKERLDKITKIYDDTEELITKELQKNEVLIPKEKILSAIKNIPEEFIDDPELFAEANKAVNKLTKLAEEKYGDKLSSAFVNQIKRSRGKRAFDKSGLQVTKEAQLRISQELNEIITQYNPAISKINEEYQKVILAKKLMQRALTRDEIGIVTRIVASSIGGGLGGSTAGFIGAGAGMGAAQVLAPKLLGTNTRSNVGAIAQKLYETASKSPTDKAGRLLINKKALLLLLNRIQNGQQD